MSTFKLDTSNLSTNRFVTLPSDMEGAFRQIQLHIMQSGIAQDMEVHYISLSLTDLGMSKESF